MAAYVRVHTPLTGEKLFRADSYNVIGVTDPEAEDPAENHGYLEITRALAGSEDVEIIATFRPDEWTWVEMLDRKPTSERPQHPRRQRTSSEEGGTIRSINGEGQHLDT